MRVSWSFLSQFVDVFSLLVRNLLSFSSSFSSPSLPFESHRSRLISAPHCSLFYIMCQNRPRCLILSLSFHPPSPSVFLCHSAAPNSCMTVQRHFLLTNDRCEQPPWDGWRISWPTSRLCPYLNHSVTCVLRVAVVFQTEAAADVNSEHNQKWCLPYHTHTHTQKKMSFRHKNSSSYVKFYTSP